MNQIEPVHYPQIGEFHLTYFNFFHSLNVILAAFLSTVIPFPALNQYLCHAHISRAFDTLHGCKISVLLLYYFKKILSRKAIHFFQKYSLQKKSYVIFKENQAKDIKPGDQ